ncbi:MAG: putative O-glycosylation ligase, exosortase A system-associated [Sphingorhabdus sp.]
MRDLFFVGYLGLLMLFAFKRPFLFTLVYAYIDIIAPQRLSYFLLNSIPLSLIVFGLALLGFLVGDDKRDVRISPRWILLIVLLVYCGYTTTVAVEPLAALDKWSWVWKALVFAAFLPLLLKTRLRIEAMLLTMVLCASALIVTGGIKTAAGGGGYGMLVILTDTNTGLYESSTIACLAIALIPIIVWLAQHGTIFKPEWKVYVYAGALIFACLLIPVGTQARTGLVCVAALALLFIRQTKRRFLYLSCAALIGTAAIPFLPSAFSQRMETMRDYKTDESAATRIAVWKWTWEFAKEHPLGGGFEAYRLNKIRYDLPVIDENGFDTGERDRKEIVDQGRAYHSAYFEMLGEQGFPGLIIWLLIHVGGVWRMEVISRLYRKRNRPDEIWVAPLARALQNAHIIYLIGALFIGIAFQPFVYMFVGIQIGLDTYLSRRRHEALWRPINARGKSTVTLQAGNPA